MNSIIELYKKVEHLVHEGFKFGLVGLAGFAVQLTSPLADNIAANVIGLGLGTMFRFWSYRRFVFLAAQG